jgi:NADH dehydrogenase/NADH:ubiquinone oxidoreductase subunit G
VVLPAPTWFEKAGTILNFEGTAMPVRQVIAPRAGVRDDKAVLEALLK